MLFIESGKESESNFVVCNVLDVVEKMEAGLSDVMTTSIEVQTIPSAVKFLEERGKDAYSRTLQDTVEVGE